MNKKNLVSLITALLLTFAGGFVDAYTFIYRGGVFATMQTGNLIKLFVNLTNGVFKLIYLLPIIVFLIGCIVAVLLEKTKYFSQITLIALLVSYVFVGFWPQKEAWDIVCVCILSFTGAMQFEAFRRCLGYRYTSTMCTNNMRLLGKSIANKRVREVLVYSTIIATFVVGIVIGVLLGKAMDVCSIWPVASIFLAILIIQLITKETPENEKIAE